MALNPIQTNGLEKIAAGASRQVLGAIQNASMSTGVDFAYLVQQAKAESSFRPDAKARTSSATGLYQFIKSTWMDMIDKYGEKYGIDTNQSRSQLLNLRKDPEVASFMAAEFANENRQFLEEHWGGEIGSTELYFAHFLGAGGASSFLNAKDQNPTQKAAYIFPEAAKANRNVFYDVKTGRPKTMDEVYAFFDKKFAVKDFDMAQNQPSAEPEKVQSVVFADGTKDFIVWNDPPKITPVDYERSRAFRKTQVSQNNQGYVPYRARNPIPAYQVITNPVNVMMLSQLDSRRK